MRSEFQINIKASRRSRKQAHTSIKKEPMIRQYLVLAYQIKQYLEENPNKTASAIASWLRHSPSRVIVSIIFRTFKEPPGVFKL